jgi:hypothetical protein
MDGSEITLHLSNCFSPNASAGSVVEHLDDDNCYDDILDDHDQDEEMSEEAPVCGDRWSLEEQHIIEAAVAAAVSQYGCYHVTLPIPYHSSNWWDALNEKTAPFAGFLWLDDSTTLQQLLISGGFRSEMPNVPARTMEPLFPELPTPRSRPVCGLTAPCKLLCGARQADSWWIQFDPSFEVLVRLIDCYTPPIMNEDGEKIDAGMRAYQRAADYLYWPQAKLSCTIPMLEGSTNWWTGLVTRSEHPAYVWITDQYSLNDILVRQQLASSKPPTAAGTHDRRCA